MGGFLDHIYQQGVISVLYLTMSSSLFISFMFLQVLEKIPYFGMADYFSLGVIVYMMVFDRHPFLTGMESKAEIRMKVTTMQPYYPEIRGTDLHDIIERVSIHRTFTYFREKVLSRLHIS